MAFTYAITDETGVWGNHRVVMGTYAQASGDTGGDIVLPTSPPKFFHATGATKVSVSGATVTIVTADPLATVSGFWIAVF